MPMWSESSGRVGIWIRLADSCKMATFTGAGPSTTKDLWPSSPRLSFASRKIRCRSTATSLLLSEADEESGRYGTEWLAENYFPKIDCAAALNEGGWIIENSDGSVYPVPASDLSRMHGNDERVSVRSLAQGTDLIYNVLRRVATEH